VFQDDGFNDLRRKLRHAIKEPARRLAAVQRKSGATDALRHRGSERYSYRCFNMAGCTQGRGG
jgi:hypothetical protein